MELKGFGGEASARSTAEPYVDGKVGRFTLEDAVRPVNTAGPNVDSVRIHACNTAADTAGARQPSRTSASKRGR